MSDQCENIKAVLAENHNGLTALAQLVAIYTSAGMAGVAEIALRTGYSERAIRKAMAELRCRNQGAAEPGCRNPGAESGTQVPQRNPGAGTPVPESSRVHATKESPSEISSFKQTDSREREVGQPVFNQASENLIQDAARWMGSERHHAVKWVTSTIAASSSEAVMAAYAQLLESQTKGKLIADPIRYIGKTAPTLKSSAAKPAADNVLMFEGKPFVLTGPRNVRPRLD